MVKTQLAVYDGSLVYVDRFIRYTKKQFGSHMTISGFTDIAALTDFLSTNKIKVLLFSEEEAVNEKDDPEIINEKIIGNENVEQLIYLGERRNSKSKVYHINKYQSMNKILEEVEGFLEEDIRNLTEEIEAETTGIYSPCAITNLKEISFNLANRLAQSKKVLYLNFERFSGINASFNVSKDSSISNLLYFYKTNKKRIRESLEETKISMEGFDILTAPLDMADMDEIDINDWGDFLNEIARAGGYESIVIDMHEAFNNLEPIFGICKKIYMPVSQEKGENEKLFEMKEYFERRNRADLLEKIIRIKGN